MCPACVMWLVRSRGVTGQGSDSSPLHQLEGCFSGTYHGFLCAGASSTLRPPPLSLEHRLNAKEKGLHHSQDSYLAWNMGHC